MNTVPFCRMKVYSTVMSPVFPPDSDPFSPVVPPDKRDAAIGGEPQCFEGECPSACPGEPVQASCKRLLGSGIYSATTVAEYVEALLATPRFCRQVTHHRVLEAVSPEYGEPGRPWNAAMRTVLDAASVRSLYAHQSLAVDLVRAGKDIVVATHTASGKSFTYNLPVIERFVADPEATALYIFPLKALAQDQLNAFRALTAHWPQDARPKAAIYDGDTTGHFRKKIRNAPPQVLITNPEMLHLGILPFHEKWATFLASLSTVVVDEVHTYRGILGAHVAQLFRRLERIAALYGARPGFIACSATIGNPAELVNNLTGRRAEPILQSGSPQGRRHFVFINPEESPATTAIHLLRAALARNLRTIVYAQSRRMTELISMWAVQKAGKYASKISAYRAGFLPEERRGIEERMASGDLLAVISTSALELGVDIGGLDLCILVGYPGTIMSTLQRGGRVGRSGRESAVLLIAQEDALDQYIVRRPEVFFSSSAENAVLNPENPVILARHLECAAAEMPLQPEGRDAFWLRPGGARNEAVAESIAALEAKGLLLRSAEGTTWHAARKRPQRDVDLRGAGTTLHMEDDQGNAIGSVDGHRALREAHPGAVYLHRGKSYIVTNLDLPGRTVTLTPGNPPYYTRTRGRKTTEILAEEAHSFAWGCRVGFGGLRVTEEISGYEKRAIKDGRLLGIVPLDLPPLVFETEGLWFGIPDAARLATEEALLHFMGAIHALEHAAIGILPLLVMADRNDLGGISTPMHAQLGGSAVFIYDGLPGGAGLACEAFSKATLLLERTEELIRLCPCDTGCPACVHSPKCGSGNRPIDKAGARFLLEAILRLKPDPAAFIPPRPAAEGEGGKESAFRLRSEAEECPPPQACPKAAAAPEERPGQLLTAGGPWPVLRPERAPSPLPRYGVLDVETRYSAAEVGGWHKAWKMGVSVAVLYDSKSDAFTSFSQEEIPELARRLAALELVVGFNILRFDYAVLGPHAAGVDFRAFPTLDMLVAIHERLSYRLSLDTLAKATLGVRKSADGLAALRWWKEGAVDRIAAYCRDDVELTRDLFVFGHENGYLLFHNKAGSVVRVPVSW